MYKTPFAILLLLIAVLVFNACMKEKAIAPKEPGPCEDSLTFTADIKPIFQTNCAVGSCHVSGGLAPFIATDYDTLDFFINSGALLTAIKHTGLIKMPRNNPADPLDPTSTKLPDSTIAKIECWINQGFPE